MEELDISTIKDQYALHVKLFNNVMVDIKDEEGNRRISETTNSYTWIAGHILDIQYNLAALLGLVLENPYADQFSFGKPFDPNATYPPLDQMRTDWNTLAPQITTALDQASDAHLSATAPFTIPFGDQSIKGVLGFQMHHLAYEIGQLGLYRRFLEKAAMSYQ